MCSILGHLKIINFPFGTNGKLIVFSCPKIWAHYSLIKMCSILGHLKIINFPFGTNGKLMVLGVPIFKHFRVLHFQVDLNVEFISTLKIMTLFEFLYHFQSCFCVLPTFYACWRDSKARFYIPLKHRPSFRNILSLPYCITSSD